MADKQMDVKASIEELRKFLDQSKSRKVKDILSIEIRKLESELSKILEENTTLESTAPTARNANQRYEIKLNGYGWDQSDKYVKIFVTLKNVHTIPKENIFCNLTEKSMELKIKDLENKDYVLVIKNLLEPIVTETSYWKQKTDMVVVFLTKSRLNKWSHMTEIEKRFDDNKANRFKTDEMEKKDPQDSIMSLMKNMYETGDDDMKRMIAKAWTEGQEKQKTSSLDL